MFLIKSMVQAQGGDALSAWLVKHANHPKVRARFDAIMIHLRQQPKDGWTRPQYDTLRDGVGEVRFKVERIHYRPLGFFGPNRNEFTFVYFATKKANFVPPNSIDLAVEYKELIMSGSARTVIVTRWD